MKDDKLNRFAFIETQLLWGGGLTARQLGNAFGLARQNAQGVIKAYRSTHPENMFFDRKAKRQMASEQFKPYYINADPGAFLDYERGVSMAGYFKQADEGVDLPFHDVDRLLRPQLATEPVRTVLGALQRQQAVTIYYHAKTGARMREISPNQLIFAGNRYHIRAYCHLTQQHLDFVLSRITYVESSTTPWTSSHYDVGWQTWVELVFEPDPRLPDEAASAIRHDHGLAPGQTHSIRCRKALGYYVRRELTMVDQELRCAKWQLVATRSVGP